MATTDATANTRRMIAEAQGAACRQQRHQDDGRELTDGAVDEDGLLIVVP